MNSPKLNETDYLKAWALFFICATVGGGIAGAIAGGLIGGAMGASGAPATEIQSVCRIAGFIAAIPVSYIFFRLCVSWILVPKLTVRASDEPPQIPS